MKVTVSEAMRIKKEIGSFISNTESSIRYNLSRGKDKSSRIVYGQRTENNIEILDEGKKSVVDDVRDFEEILSISEKVNTALADFNHTNGVGNMVRKRQNLKLLLAYYEKRIMENSSPSVKTERDKESGIVTTIKFDPYLNKSEIRSKIKEIKSSMRNLQFSIEKSNNKQIDLPFSYDDVYDLLND
jgi:hypothetical protein